jgi:hypothetical protein
VLTQVGSSFTQKSVDCRGSESHERQSLLHHRLNYSRKRFYGKKNPQKTQASTKALEHFFILLTKYYGKPHGYSSRSDSTRKAVAK